MVRDKIRKRLVKYTRKAFRMLPLIEKPLILDIGCGSGISTLELAKLCNGEIIGIDIDQPALNRFSNNITKAKLTDRVRILNCSMFDMDFPDESFDIIWSEGSIYAIGFERGLREWMRLLKRVGYMVIHDEKGNISEKLEQISSYGYELLGHFTLNEEAWWTEYFAPLEQLIVEFHTKHSNDPEIIKELIRAQEEVDFYKRYPERNNSVCFVIKKY